MARSGEHACPSCGSSDTLPVWEADLDAGTATALPTWLCVTCLHEFFPRLRLVPQASTDELEMAATPPCPRCESARTVPILYGLPEPELVAASARGEAVLGGCVIALDSPTVRCGACGHQFGPDDGEEVSR